MPSPDSVLFVGFGGPTPGCCQRFDPCPGSEALCFVKAIVGERRGSEARIAEVAAHYDHFGGFSPFNELTSQQTQKVSAYLQERGIQLPVYIGMRYWPPYVREVLRQMVEQAGARHVLAIILSAFQSPASLEQYQQVVSAALAELGEQAPQVTYLRSWHTHPWFIEALADTIRQAEQALGEERARQAALICTAHSIPLPMAARSPYPQQYAETAAAVARRLGRQEYRLAYQSQVTGTPIPWLQPDINDTLQQLHEQGYRDVIVAPIGFLCDHMEVLYDLDVQARDTATACGLGYVRAGTVSNHPRFVAMFGELIRECLGATPQEGCPA